MSRIVQIKDKSMEFGMMITVTVTTGNNSEYGTSSSSSKLMIKAWNLA